MKKIGKLLKYNLVGEINLRKVSNREAKIIPNGKEGIE
jgi:hypothetical protein